MSAATPTFVESPSQPAAVPGLWERFRGMITRPTATLAGLTDPDAWFWPSIMLLVGYTLFYPPIAVGMARFGAAAVTQSLTMRTTATGSGPNASAINMVRTVLPISYMFAVMLQVPVYVAISWATRTVIFYGFSRVLGGVKANWGRVVAMVGWAWVPLFIQYVVTGAAMLVSPKLFSLLMFVPDPKHPLPTEEMMRYRWMMLGLRELSPFVLWNMFLCVLGVREVFQLPRWKAALVVFLPMVLYLLFEVAMLWLSNSMVKAFGGMNAPMTPGP